jgi:anti-sigma factor RsiW
MAHRDDNDARLMDYLYGELSAAETSAFERELAGDPERADQVAGLVRARAAFRGPGLAGVFDDEPPPAASARLLHEAAKAVTGARRTATAGDGPGWLERLATWLAPMVRHPALSAVAALVVVAGAAGALWLRGIDGELPRADSVAAPAASSPAPAEVPAASAPVGGPVAPHDDDGSDRTAAASADYEAGAVQLVGQDEARELTRRVDAKTKPARRKQDSALGSSASRARAAEKKSFASAPPPAADSAAEAVERDAPVAAAAEPASERAAARVGQAAVPTLANSEAATAPVPAGSAGADSDRAYDERWAKSRHSELNAILDGAKPSAEQCQRAARVANDILDRNPDYYRERVRGSKLLAPCRMYVEREAARRTKARAGNEATSTAADAVDQAAEPAADSE